MTREEAKIILDGFKSNPLFNEQHKQALDMAISALSADGDCISRQAVIDKLNRLIEVEKLQGTDEMGYGRERVNAYEYMIHEVESEYLHPSVQPKKGEWIEWKGDNLEGVPICSHCKFGFPFLAKNYNFFPHCGADMRKPTKGD